MPYPHEPQEAAPTGGLLALDLATVLGWVYWSPDAIARWPRSLIEARAALATGRWTPDGIYHGTHQICDRGLPFGHMGAIYQSWFTRTMDRFRPAHVVREAPLAHQNSDQNIHRSMMLASVTDLMSWHRGIVARYVDVNTARKYTAGTKNVTKTDVFRLFVDRGLQPGSLDESDGMCVGDYFIGALRR